MQSVMQKSNPLAANNRSQFLENQIMTHLERRSKTNVKIPLPIQLRLDDLQSHRVMRTLIMFLCFEAWFDKGGGINNLDLGLHVPFEEGVDSIVKLMEPCADDPEIRSVVLASIDRMVETEIIVIEHNCIILL